MLKNILMLTLVFGRFVSEAMVNRSLDLGLMLKKHQYFMDISLYLHLFAQD